MKKKSIRYECKSCLSLTYRESGKHDQHKEFSDLKHFSYIRDYPTCRETHPSIRIKANRTKLERISHE